MKSFFLIFLLLLISVFPDLSPAPVVEIIEKEVILRNNETLVPLIIFPETDVDPEFPPHLTLTPQYQPHPPPRPPSLTCS